MSTIDDPIEATESQYKESGNPISRALVEEVFGVIDPEVRFAVRIKNTLIQHLFGDSSIQRQKALITTLIAVVRKLESRVQSLEEPSAEIEKKIHSEGFKQTLTVAVTETWLTSDIEKVKRFSALLGSQLVIGQDNKRTWEDVSAYIRDLSQLGDADIEALQILHSFHGEYLEEKNVVTDGFGIQSKATVMFAFDPNIFTARHKEVLDFLEKHNIPREDFYSRCARLSGFGLTLEVQRNDSRIAPGDHCFRLTVRGNRLIVMLKNAGALEEK